MYPKQDQPAFGTFVKDQVEALRKEGIDVEVLFIDGRNRRINYLLGLLRFWKRILRRKYQLIHAHYALTGYIARMQFFYPVIVTYHGGEVKDYVPRWLRFLARLGPMLFDRIIVVNKEEEAILNDSLKVRVIPCGIDLTLFHPIPKDEARFKLDLPSDAKLVLWAGEYWQFEKRYELVEEAMGLLHADCPQAELVLVSGKPHTMIPLYMNACDVLLLTSRSEGSPMVIKEAMACNLPIVSTDVGDVAERITGVEGCKIVEPNAVEIKENLLALLQHPKRTNGRDKINDLSSKIVAQRVIGIYNEVF
jgi:glycosyltransferase involved in cell wall biosynthesis